MRNKFHIGTPSITSTRPRVTIKTTTTPKKAIVVKEPDVVSPTGHLGMLEGQDSSRKLLNLKIKAFQNAGRPIGHWLFTGPSGYGKTIFAEAFADDLGVPRHTILGNRIQKWNEITSILMTIEENNIFFIDEIHALPPLFQNNLYDIMAKSKFNEITSKGIVEHNLPDFSIFGATTHEGYLNEALRNRFRNNVVMMPYTRQQLANIIINGARIQGINILPEIGYKMANVVMGTPRRAETLLKNVIDVADAYGTGVNQTILEETLQLMNLDPYLGLNYTARKYLFTLYKNGATGKVAISEHINEEEETVDSLEKFFFSIVEVEELDIRGPLVTKGGGRKLTNCGKQYIEAVINLKNEGWFPEEVWF